MKYSWRRRAWIRSLILFLSLECSTCFGTSPSDTSGRSPAASQLINLTEERFHDLSAAEAKLVEAVADGTDADCTKFTGKDRTIRSDLLSWLCVNPGAAAQITSQGVSILGAEIEGVLNLEWTKISFPLRTRQCVFTGAIILRNSRLAVLDLEDTSAKAIEGEGLIAEYGVFLRHGFRAEGGVDLRNARDVLASTQSYCSSSAVTISVESISVMRSSIRWMW